MSSSPLHSNRSVYEGIKKHNALMASLLNNRSKNDRPKNPDSRVSPQPRTDLDSPKRNKIRGFFSSSTSTAHQPTSPASSEVDSPGARPSPRHLRLKEAAKNMPTDGAPLLE